MKKYGKRYNQAKENISDSETSKEDSINICKENATANFDESVDVVFSLGIDPEDAEQNIRTTVSLPNGTGKEVKIAVFAGGEQLSEAESAGADVVGGKELATKVASEEKLDIDVVISTPEMMAEVGQLGKILGPQGLMPNPKTGTVTTNVAKAVEDFKKGKVEIKNDKLGNVHLAIGKSSFDTNKLLENFNEVIAVVEKARPASTKGDYVKSVHISSTMGPSLSVDINLYLESTETVEFPSFNWPYSPTVLGNADPGGTLTYNGYELSSSINENKSSIGFTTSQSTSIHIFCFAGVFKRVAGFINQPLLFSRVSNSISFRSAHFLAFVLNPKSYMNIGLDVFF